VAIYPMEIASHSFAMTSINSSLLNATWYYIFSVPALISLDAANPPGLSLYTFLTLHGYPFIGSEPLMGSILSVWYSRLTLAPSEE